MIAPLIAYALLAFGPAPVTLTVNVKDGEVISGEKLFKVSVQAKNPVTQVDFTVGPDLRSSDMSVPYEYKLDTLGENDGPLKIKFSAYTNQGENGTKTITVTIDNGISKGAPYHISRANEYLTNSKYNEALFEGRIAIKADPKSRAAKFILARSYLGLGNYDKAQKYAEDTVQADPKAKDALDLLAGVNLQRAFIMVNRSGDRKETEAAIADAVKGAAMARRANLDAQVDTFGPVTDANRMAFVDLATTAGRYSLAIDQLAPLFRKDPKNNEVANRLVFNQLRAGRYEDAGKTLGDMKKFGLMDAYGNALQAVYYTEIGDDSKADEAIREGILSDGDNMGVKTAQAYIALKRNRTSVLSRLVADLSKTESQRTEVNYYLSALDNRRQDPAADRYFKRALLIEPSNYDMYIERGNYSLGLAFRFQASTDSKAKTEFESEVSFAKTMFEAALISRPESYQALVGLTIVSLAQKNTADALKYGKAAVAAGPQYAGSHYALAAAYVAANQGADANRENAMAGKIDKVSLQGRELPKAAAVWQYFATGGRTVVIAPPGKA